MAEYSNQCLGFDSKLAGKYSRAKFVTEMSNQMKEEKR
jgi:hypothetical protein